MLIPKEKIDVAKKEYDGQAIEEIVEFFGLQDTYNEKYKSCSCPFHTDKTPSFIWNTKADCFHCFSCDTNYDIIDLYMAQGMTYLEAVETLFTKTGIEYSFGEKGLKTKASYRYPTREESEDRSQVETYLQSRCISSKTLDYADIQSDKNNNIVFHFYDSNDVLLTVKYRPSHKIKSGENKCWFQKDSDNTPLLFNMNKIDPSKPLVITEGELDCLSIIEAGYNNVVSVPGGSQNMGWLNHNYDWLAQFEKIIIWGDNDAPGIKMRNEAINRLGSWRTYYIEITDKTTIKTKGDSLCKDANEILYCYGKEKVLEYINSPLELPIEGVIDLADAGEFDIENTEGLYTRIEDLDDKIYKIPFGTLAIITGKSGEGKSVFVNQLAICQALDQGYDVFTFSGELPPNVLRNWIDINMIGRENISLKENHIRVLDKESLTKMRNWYRGKVYIYDDSQETTATAIMLKMEEMARKIGTKVFLIDNLMMVDLECTDEGRLQAEKNFIKDLIFFAKNLNVLVFLVAHPRKTGEVLLTKDDIAGSSNIVNLAHMVFSVHRYTDKEKEGETNGRGEFIKGKEPVTHDVIISVLKNRLTGQLPSVDMYFDYTSYRFYRNKNELDWRYKWHPEYTQRPNLPFPHSNDNESLGPLDD